MNSFSSGLYFSSREGFLAEAVVPVAGIRAASRVMCVSFMIIGLCFELTPSV